MKKNKTEIDIPGELGCGTLDLTTWTILDNTVIEEGVDPVGCDDPCELGEQDDNMSGWGTCDAEELLAHGDSCEQVCNSVSDYVSPFTCDNGDLTRGICEEDVENPCSFEDENLGGNISGWGTCDTEELLAHGDSCIQVCKSGSTNDSPFTCDNGELTRGICKYNNTSSSLQSSPSDDNSSSGTSQSSPSDGPSSCPIPDVTNSKTEWWKDTSNCSDKQLESGKQCNVTCAEGYELRDEEYFKCDEGELESSAPTCTSELDDKDMYIYSKQHGFCDGYTVETVADAPDLYSIVCADNKTAGKSRYKFYANEDGTYKIQNKSRDSTTSGLGYCEGWATNMRCKSNAAAGHDFNVNKTDDGWTIKKEGSICYTEAGDDSKISCNTGSFNLDNNNNKYFSICSDHENCS